MENNNEERLGVKEAIYEITTISLNRMLKELKDNEIDNFYINVKDLKELVALLGNVDKTMLEEAVTDDSEVEEYEVTLGGHEDEM